MYNYKKNFLFLYNKGDKNMNNLLDNFGTNCFSEKNLKNRVPDYVVKKFLEIKNGKAELTLEIADIIANAINMWALE